MRQFIPVLIALISLVAFTGCNQNNVESLKKHTQETGNTIEVTETAPDGTVIQHLKVSPTQIEASSVFQTPDTEEAGDVASDSGGGDQADARSSACTHSGLCTLAKHAAIEPWQTEHVHAVISVRRAETRFGPQVAHATSFAKSRKASNRVPPIGSLSSRQ